LRIFSIKVEDRVEQKYLKNKETWFKTLRHFDAGLDSTLRVFKGWWPGRRLKHSATPMAIFTSVISTGMAPSGTGTTTGSTTISIPTILPPWQLF